MSQEITAIDDSFHQATGDDPYWTETAYWGFYVPDRNLSGTVYNMWRKNLGLVSSRVWVWDDNEQLPQGVRYSAAYEQVVIPEKADATNFELPTGLTVECVEPLNSHRLRYRDGDALTFDLLAEATQPPTAAFRGHGEGTGHFDQHIHVTGTMQLFGENLAVDCYSMRDRTWSARSDFIDSSLVAGYMHGGSKDGDCWLVMGVGSPESPGEQPIPPGVGSLVRDGRKATVVEGTRRVTQRRDGRPERIELTFVDEDGRSCQVSGEALNHLGVNLNPSIFNWFSLYRWTDENGQVYYGECQETWIPPSSLRLALARGQA